MNKLEFVAKKFRAIEEIPVLFLCLLACIFLTANINAQGNKTIVLARHVEKDASPTADKADPELTAEGRERAVRLMHAIKKYKPHEIFSTSYKRTRETAEPIAKRRKVEIQMYEAQKQNELVEKMLASKTERFFIIGHSNTIPMLANLLAKKEIFRPLLESEYGVFWVIRIKKGVVTRVEVFPY